MTADKKQTALVVEDNEDNMVLITMILQQAGYETLWAETGTKGIQLVLENKPDFVLLDMQLPDINGTEVLKRIRALDSEIAGLPIVVMSADVMRIDNEELQAAGCNGHIEKPIDPMRVIKQIQTILEEAL